MDLGSWATFGTLFLTAIDLVRRKLIALACLTWTLAQETKKMRKYQETPRLSMSSRKAHRESKAWDLFCAMKAKV